MNKRQSLLTFFVLFSLILVVSCSKTAPLEQDQPIATEEPIPTPGPVQNPCENIFYPLNLNNQWIYRFDIYKMNYDQKSIDADASDLALTVSEVTNSSAMVSVLDFGTGIITESSVDCQDQAIINFPMLELKMVFGELTGDLNLEYKSGVFMPSGKDLEASNWNMEWETEYIADGVLESTYEGEPLTATLSSSPVKMKWQVAGTNDSLEVSGGKFDNLVKINREISFDISNLHTNLDGNEVNLATTLSINTDMWYAPQIGLIKQEISSASIKIFGIDFPIDTWGYIELTSTTIN
jgi:hypothetical protein